MQALIEHAQLQGKHVMTGAIDAGNDCSIRHHRRFGLEISDHMPEVETKFGRWRDLIWMQRRFSSPGSS